MARASGDPEALAATLRGRHWAISSTEDLEDRLETSTNLMRLGEEQGDTETAFQGHSPRLMDLLEDGDIPAAAAEQEHLARLARGLPQPLARWEATLAKATLTIFAGRLDEGEQLAREALGIGEQMERWAATGSYQIQMVWPRRIRGELGEGDVTWLTEGAKGSALLLPTFQAHLGQERQRIVIHLKGARHGEQSVDSGHGRDKDIRVVVAAVGRSYFPVVDKDFPLGAIELVA